MMKSTRFEGDDQDLAGRIDEFMSRFKMGTLLSRAGIRKVRGSSPLLILRTIFESAFVGRNVYTGVGEFRGTQHRSARWTLWTLRWWSLA